MSSVIDHPFFHAYRRYRTPVLAVLSTLILLASAVWSFDVPWRLLLEYMMLCALGVGLLIVLAGLVVAVFKLLC